MKFLKCFSWYYVELIMFLYCSCAESKNDRVHDALKRVHLPRVITKLLFPKKKTTYVSVPYLIAALGCLIGFVLGSAASLIICVYGLDVIYMEAVGALGAVIMFLSFVCFLLLVIVPGPQSIQTKVIVIPLLVAVCVYLLYLLAVIFLKSGDELCLLFLTPFYPFIAEP